MSSENNFNLQNLRENKNWVDWRAVSPYKVVRDLYFGDGMVSNPKEPSCLVPNATELYFQTRRALTPYAPWFALHIDAQYEPLYTEVPPSYENISPNYIDFVRDCNRNGTSVDDFKMDFTAYCLMDGVTFMASGYDGDTTKYPWFHYYTAP